MVSVAAGVVLTVALTKLEKTQEQTLAVAVATSAKPGNSADLCFPRNGTPYVTTHGGKDSKEEPLLTVEGPMSINSDYPSPREQEGHSGHSGHNHDAEHDHHVSHQELQFKGDKWTPIILALAFSVHSLTTGMALGMQSGQSKVVSLFIAVISHKSIEALSIGTSFSQQRVPLSIAWPSLLVYTAGVPVGILVGTVIMESFHSNMMIEAMTLVVMGAAGSFLYFGITHMAGNETTEVSRWQKTMLVTPGIILMAGVCLLPD